MRDRSGLCQAALDGNLEGVRYQVSKGMPLDGSGCARFDDDVEGCVKGAPLHTPLGEAARMGHTEIVHALLEGGALVDEVDYRGETPLILAAFWDRPKSVELLLARGAKPDQVGCLGSALASLQPGFRPGAIEVAKMLFAAGASPLATARYTESALDKWLGQISNGKAAKKIAPKLLELLRLALPRAGDQASRVSTAIAQLEAQLDKSGKTSAKAASRYAQPAQADSKTWQADVKSALGSIETEAGRAAIESVCKQVLATPTAIAHRAWPQLVLDVLALSKTYADVTKNAYGKALPISKMADDDGGAVDDYGDNHLYTFDWVLQVLAQPAAIAHPHWPALVGAVCDAKKTAVGHYSFGDEEIAALLAVDQVKWHEQFASVLAAAKDAFPYASCFGANGEHRDFPTVGAPKLPAPPKASSSGAATTKATRENVANAAPKKALAKKAPPKKTPAKKAPAKKGAPKKAPAKKAPAKKAPPKKR